MTLPQLSLTIAALGQAEKDERQLIQNALVEMGPASIPAVLESARDIPLAKLSGENWQAEAWAARYPVPVPSLTRALKQHPGNGAGLLSLICQKIGDKSPTTRQAILPSLEHDQAIFRGAALSALVASTAKPNSLMPRLQAAMGDSNSSDRRR